MLVDLELKKELGRETIGYISYQKDAKPERREGKRDGQPKSQVL